METPNLKILTTNGVAATPETVFVRLDVVLALVEANRSSAGGEEKLNAVRNFNEAMDGIEYTC